MATNGQLSYFDSFLFFLLLFHDNLQLCLRLLFFRDELNIKFSDNDAVVDPNAFQNIHTKDGKVIHVMKFDKMNYVQLVR